MNTKASGESVAVVPDHEALRREWNLRVEACTRAPVDAAAHDQLVAFLVANPDFARQAYNCAEWSRKMLMCQLFHKEGQILWSSWRDQTLALEKSLAGPASSAAVTALAQQAGTEFLWLQSLQLAMGKSPDWASRSWSDLIDSVQRRYLRTLKMLAVVRRLEKGLEMTVTHHHVTVPERPPVGGRFQRNVDAEVAEVEGLCVRQPTMGSCAMP